MNQKRPDPSRLRLSLAACALVVATTTAEPSTQMASGAVASAAAAATCVLNQAQLLKRIDAYCRRSWQNARIARDEWADCTQDVYLRVLDSLGLERLITAIELPDSDERRELNRAIWATTQRRKRATVSQPLPEFEIVDERSDFWPAREAAVQQVRSAIDSGSARLSPTQSEILSRWSAGQSVAEIARTLTLSPSRVSDEKYKAIRKLREFFGTDPSNV